MVRRGFRHLHDRLPAPRLLANFRDSASPDLLPWADPYIASLFGVNELEDPNSIAQDEDEEESSPRR